MKSHIESKLAPRKLSVLMADDNVCDIMLLRHGFAAAGIPAVVHAASSGSEAISFLQEHEPPDVIVLDFTLPDQTGIEVLRCLERDCRWRRLGKILLSGLLPLLSSQSEFPNVVRLEKPCLLEEWAGIAEQVAESMEPDLPAKAA